VPRLLGPILDFLLALMTLAVGVGGVIAFLKAVEHGPLRAFHWFALLGAITIVAAGARLLVYLRAAPSIGNDRT
jgi:hypothetical protein